MLDTIADRPERGKSKLGGSRRRASASPISGLNPVQVVADVRIEEAQIFSHLDVGKLFSTISPRMFVDPGNWNLQDCGDFLNGEKRALASLPLNAPALGWTRE